MGFNFVIFHSEQFAKYNQENTDIGIIITNKNYKSKSLREQII